MRFSENPFIRYAQNRKIGEPNNLRENYTHQTIKMQNAADIHIHVINKRKIESNKHMLQL
jgi:hypothetical protein